MKRRPLLGIFVLAPALLVSCSRRAGKAAPTVLLIGVDGADMGIVDRLIGEGKLPTFARLKKEGGLLDGGSDVGRYSRTGSSRRSRRTPWTRPGTRHA